MALMGTEYTVTATAARPFAGQHVPCQQIVFSGLTGNTASAYIGGSGLTATTNRLAEVVKGGNYTIGPFATGPFYLDDIYVVGTANDKLFIWYIPF